MQRAVVITGNARADHALLALARLLAEIAASIGADKLTMQLDAEPGTDVESPAAANAPAAAGWRHAATQSAAPTEHSQQPATSEPSKL